MSMSLFNKIPFMLIGFVLLCAFQRVPVFAEIPERPKRELLRFRLLNDAQGEIAVSYNQGKIWQAIGHVLRYTTQTDRRGYTASKWAPAGRVAATAVNAIHISVGYNEKEDRGIVFSLLPRELLTTPINYSSFLSPNSSIYTDIPAGTGIFGGGVAPFVGNEVYLERGDKSFIALESGYGPGQGDTLMVIVTRPERYPVEAVFENWEGGAVTLRYNDRSRELLGWVIRPVKGIGRFLGSIYAGIGRIRANHTGVIDVSTSPLGNLGAFQIIPAGHALSPEMGLAWQLTQWMIVGPISDNAKLWDGLNPLFYQHLRPDYLPTDLYCANWRERLLARFLVEVDLGEGWQPLPSKRLAADPNVPLPKWAGGALQEVKRIRILFPQIDFVRE